jgi:phosphatidylglycerophosphatase C
MVTTDPNRQTGPGRPVAAFDFDGTLTVRDSFTAFLRWRKGSAAYFTGMARLVPALLRWLSDRDRTRLKAAMVRIYLKGVPLAVLEQEAAAFAEGHAARLLRPDALEAWAQHGAEGAERVIVTASPDVTVAPFAARLQADRLIGTRLAIDGSGRVAGALDGLNCRGAEKVRRLREVYGEPLRLTAAYGDTAGDTEMLAIADRPGFRVFKGRP